MTGKTISQNLNLKPVFFTLLLIVFLSSCGEKTTYLPYLGEHETTEIVVDGETKFDTIYYKIPEFTLTDQDSLSFTQEDVAAHVDVNLFFFPIVNVFGFINLSRYLPGYDGCNEAGL